MDSEVPILNVLSASALVLLSGCVGQYVSSDTGPHAFLNVTLLNHYGTASIDITPPGNGMFGEERLLKNANPGVIASTAAIVPTDRPVRLSFEEKIYGKIFVGFFEFDATTGVTYDVVGGDKLPANPPSLVDKVARAWAPYAGAVCYFQVFEREANGSKVALPHKQWGLPLIP